MLAAWQGWGCVCRRQQECLGVCPASFLPTSGGVGLLSLTSGPLSMPVASEGLGLLV